MNEFNNTFKVNTITNDLKCRNFVIELVIDEEGNVSLNKTDLSQDQMLGVMLSSEVEILQKESISQYDMCIDAMMYYMNKILTNNLDLYQEVSSVDFDVVFKAVNDMFMQHMLPTDQRCRVHVVTYEYDETTLITSFIVTYGY